MRRLRRRRISARHHSTSRSSRLGSPRTRSGAPALKNILSQLGGLAGGTPWHKRRAKHGLARRPKSLRMEGLERREMLDGEQVDISLDYADSQFGGRIGPAYYPNTLEMSTPVRVFASGESFLGDFSLFTQSFDLHYSIESDMQLGVDYRLYVYAYGSAGEEIDDLNGAVTVEDGIAAFDIKFLRDLEENEEHYVRVTLLDSDDYDVPGSPGYNAPIEYSTAYTQFETWYNLATRVAYFRGASDPSTPNVPPVVDCDCGCHYPGETEADVKEENGAATVTHKLSGSDQGNPNDASAPPLGVLSYNSAAVTSPTLRGYDTLDGTHYDSNDVLKYGPPKTVEVTASYYQLNLSSGFYDELISTRATSFFATDYDGAQFGTNSGVQYALTPDASSLATGVYQWRMNVKYHWADGSVEERGADLQGWQFILNDSDSVFGKGWQFSEAPSLTVQDGGKKIALRQGQNARAFYENSIGEYDSGVGGEGLTLSSTSVGIDYTDKFGTKYSYSSAGRLLEYVDRNDNKTVYVYSGSGGTGNLLAILYPNGRRTKFEYEGGYVSRIIENALEDGSGGTSTWLDVDANGHLLSITGEDADGSPSSGLPAPVTAIEYVEGTDLVEIVKRDIVSPLTPTETTYEQTTYEYHLPSGTVTSVMRSSGTGSNSGASSMELFAAQRWGAADPTIVDNNNYAQGTIDNPAPLRAIGAPQGSKSEQISATEWRESTFTIDGFQQISSRTISPGTADAATTVYHRNADGLVWRMIEADPDGAGPLASPVTIYDYDSGLNLETISLPNGQSQAWTYGAKNQVSGFTDELGRQTIYNLDDRGNVNYMQQVVGAPNTLENPGDDLFTRYEYTAAPTGQTPGTRLPGGLVTKITDPLENVTQYTYYRADSSEAGAGTVDADRVGLLQSITYAVNTTDEATVSFGYDTRRRLTSQTDELARTTDYAYDAQNRTISITQPDADPGDNLGRPITTFAYDTLGRLAKQTDPDPDAPGAGTREAHWTEYNYSNNDRTLTVKETPRESGGAVIQTIYDYDVLGRLVKATDALGNETEYTYTDLDQVATVKLPAAASGAPAPVYSYIYDQLGRLTQVTRPSAAARTAPTPQALAEVEATELDLQSVVTLFDPANPASAAFVDTVDADGALRYEIVAVNSPASFFKSLRFAADGGRQLILEYAEFIGAGSATVTLRATNTAGLSSELEIEVTRSTVNTSAQTVNTTTAGDQQNSSVAAFADGSGYVIVWEGAGPSGTDDSGIWFQRFDSSGNKVGGQTLVNTSTSGEQGKPMVAASDDGFAVAWYDYVNSSAAQIRWRTFDHSGNAASAEKSYWSNIAVPLGGPAIARLLPTDELPDSRYVVTWALRGVTSLGDDVYGQVVDAEGNAVSNAFRANPASPGAQQRPSIAPTKDGGFIIAWDGDGSFGSTSTATTAIFLRRFQANGTAPWVETRVDLTNDISSYAATSDGGLVVVWQDQATAGSDAVIKGRRFAADGTPASSEFVISAGPDIPTGVSHERPSVAGTPDGGFVVAWYSDQSSGIQIYTRRYDRFGAPVAVEAAASAATTSDVDIVSGPGGGVFMTWTQVSSGQADVMATLARLPYSLDSEPAVLKIESVTPGQAVIGAVDSILVTFNKTMASTLNLSAVSLTKPDGSSLTTGFSAARISTTQYLISLPAAQNAPGEYHLAIDANLVSGLDAGVIMAFTIVAPADQAGGTINYAYDSLNRVVETTDAAGAVTRYTYTPQSDGELRITESRFLPSNLTTPFATTTYDYNALGQLVLVTLPLVAGLNSAPTIAYSYDKNGNLLRTTDPRGAKTDSRYDARGRLIRRYDPNASSGNSVDGNDAPLGPATQYKYTLASELEEIIGPTVLGPSGTITPHTFYEYDGLGRVKKITSGKPVDGQLASSPIFTSYQYDQVGNLVSLTEPASGVTPLDGRAPTAALATTYGYDTQSNLTRVTLPNPTTDYSGAAPKVDYAYDDLGRRTGVVDELGRRTDYLYDRRGNLSKVVEANPASVGDTSLTSAARPKYVYAYDLADNLLVETDPLGRSTQYRYDTAGRLTHQIDAAGGVSLLGYDPLSRQTSQTDALGRRTDFEYDALDQLRKVTEANPLLPGQAGYSGTARPEYQYQYDAAGNLVTYTDPLQRVTDYTFDKLGRLTDVAQPTIAQPGGGSTRPNTAYAYDDSGNVTSVTDPLSRVTAYRYDGLGRRASRRDPDPTTLGGSAGQLTTYGYDNRSQLVQVRQPEPGTSQFIDTNYDYDAAGRVLRETQPEVTESYTNGSYASAHRTALTYSYDLAGQLTSFKDQMNLETTYGYDYLGRQTTKTVISPRGTYDPDHDIVTSFRYDAVGNQTKVTDPIGAITVTTYDALNRATAIMDAREGVTRFGFDAVGNQTSLTDAAGNVNRWAFDRLNRLSVDTDPLGNSRLYQYDAAGNLTRQTDRLGQVRTFDYDPLDRRTAENWLDPADGESITR
ncbi:MAG: hypothetical protein K2Y37_00005, partial [Pirellulales bacterium]|nr:hypothetical protein [Pirellulales bacterium]